MSKNFLHRVFFVCLLAGGFGAAALIVAYNAFYGEAVKENISLFVDKDTTYDQLCEKIEGATDNSLLKSTAFKLYASHIDLANRFLTELFSYSDENQTVPKTILQAKNNLSNSENNDLYNSYEFLIG